jgi:hypothetical protein
LLNRFLIIIRTGRSIATSTRGPNTESDGNSGTLVCVQATPDVSVVPEPNVPPPVLLSVSVPQAPFWIIATPPRRLVLSMAMLLPPTRVMTKPAPKLRDPVLEMVRVVADGIARLSPVGILTGPVTVHVSVPAFQDKPGPEQNEELTVIVVAAATVGTAPTKIIENEITNRPKTADTDVFFPNVTNAPFSGTVSCI